MLTRKSHNVLLLNDRANLLDCDGDLCGIEHHLFPGNNNERPERSSAVS